MSLALVVRFDLPDPAAAQRFDALLGAALPAVRTEPGTHLYVPHTSATEPLVRLVYAVYADRAAHERHNAAPGMARFLRELPDLRATVRVEELVPTPDVLPA
ncbi:antibiotic biosynthesis monooxygenase [Kineococcus aurantiacus]|uniref:Quinol monooxygenase YgiN n=1 Tax=Kineococcus aurantiacus TaxID=37633 RepID=A0A7Y9ASN2_9ACTN|nr:quinol monooxygenase YgiN [Kineococcus aurantiacus]